MAFPWSIRCSWRARFLRWVFSDPAGDKILDRHIPFAGGFKGGVCSFEDVFRDNPVLLGPLPPQNIFVEMTRSERFQPTFLITLPMTISALPVCIGFCIIEEIYPGFVSCLHTIVCNLFSDLTAVSDPGSYERADTFNPMNLNNDIPLLSLLL